MSIKFLAFTWIMIILPLCSRSMADNVNHVHLAENLVYMAEANLSAANQRLDEIGEETRLAQLQLLQIAAHNKNRLLNIVFQNSSCQQATESSFGNAKIPVGHYIDPEKDAPLLCDIEGTRFVWNLDKVCAEVLQKKPSSTQNTRTCKKAIRESWRLVEEHSSLIDNLGTMKNDLSRARNMLMAAQAIESAKTKSSRFMNLIINRQQKPDARVDATESISE